MTLDVTNFYRLMNRQSIVSESAAIRKADGHCLVQDRK
jgi:hypothetical protein